MKDQTAITWLALVAAGVLAELSASAGMSVWSRRWKMMNTAVMFGLGLLVVGVTANAAYVPFTGNEPGTLYLYHLDGSGTGGTDVSVSSGKVGGLGLTLLGTALTSEPSPWNNCAYFNRPGVSIAYISGDSAIPSTSSLYLDLWANPKTDGGGGLVICKDKAFGLAVGADGSLTSFIGTGSAWVSSAFITSDVGKVSFDAWNHIQLQYNGSMVDLLVNGQSVGSKNWSGTIAGGGDVTLGNWGQYDQSAVGDHYSGMIDEVWVGTAIPEPASLALLGLGALGLLRRRR